MKYLIILLMLVACSTNNTVENKPVTVVTPAPIKEVAYKIKTNNNRLKNLDKSVIDAMQFALVRVIERNTKFKMATCTNMQIANAIKDYMSSRTTYLRTYRPKWRYSKAIAYAKGDSIYYNQYKLGRSIARKVETACHELVHLADQRLKSCTFGHGNNSPKGKADTTPYLVGTWCYKYMVSK